MGMIGMLTRAGLVLTLMTGLTASCQPGPATLPLANAAQTADQMPRITAADLKKRIDAGEPIVIADTRAAAQFQTERIQGAVNVPYSDPTADFSQLPKDRFVALYCT
jgi:hypothetical protein